MVGGEWATLPKKSMVRPRDIINKNAPDSKEETRNRGADKAPVAPVSVETDVAHDECIKDKSTLVKTPREYEEIISITSDVPVSPESSYSLIKLVTASTNSVDILQCLKTKYAEDPFFRVSLEKRKDY